MDQLTSVRMLALWRTVFVELVRQKGPDLSPRQMAVLMTVYTLPGPHTVRGLSAFLHIRKPAISRALDFLCRLGLVRRKIDASDRRSVLLQRTVKGSVYLTDFSQIVLEGEEKEV